MRILSARATEVAHDRATQMIAATIVIRIEVGEAAAEHRVRVAAPVIAQGGAPLKERLVAVAKLTLAMDGRTPRPPEAELVRPAA
ncbi:hypothetical protein OU426_17540 [Frigidibacter sp. RF13]|uniref:hypothetical protein n=1 Tax=Frigidibacter sp. RF13 TaxID=2997340 RepID=UPI0022703270|nr:hypothetical protein [Frigidibacter sp. RF13]MCY1128664.1 hypothetical protein [Frigidibacter sp. RF13]